MKKRRGGGSGAPGGLSPVYEGPEVLSALLQAAGSPHDAEEVAAKFREAQKTGEPRSAVIPALFPEEPRFPTPDSARRLYSNLFGLWSRIAAGFGARDDAPEVVPEPPPPPPLPERGSVSGSELRADLVEAVWRHLAAGAPREVQRRRDRFQNVQPDLAGWLDALDLPESCALAAIDLSFEAWAMLDQAFGERLGTVDWKDLRAIEEEPPPLEATQPAFAAYAAEQLDVLEDEAEDFGPEQRAQVERVIAAAVAALTDAVAEPS